MKGENMNNKSLIQNETVFLNEVTELVQKARDTANSAVSSIIVVTYWNIGKKIVEQEQAGKDRAEYGKQVIEVLANNLTRKFGTSYNKRNLQYFRKFYLSFKNFEIVNTCVHNLNWSHFRRLLSVASEAARLWYLKEANNQMWSVRTLDRNISTQYYERLLISPKKEKVIEEMKSKTAEYKDSQFELIKSPVIAEFLGFKANDYSETELESAILTHIRDFLMEMGKGFAFVARQQHIVTETDDYFMNQHVPGTKYDDSYKKLGDIIYDFTGASNLFTGSGITASANGIENIERGFNNYKGFDISEMRDYQNIKIFRFEVINDASKKIKRVYVKELNQ